VTEEAQSPLTPNPEFEPINSPRARIEMSDFYEPQRDEIGTMTSKKFSFEQPLYCRVIRRLQLVKAV
jgi:hypothetical protein